jgi:hypothetical protein
MRRGTSWTTQLVNKMKQVSVSRPVGCSTNVVVISLFMLYLFCYCTVLMWSPGDWVDVAEVAGES